MRKVLYLLSLVLLFAAGCDDQNKEQATALADDKIYFFYYNECPYCHDAMDYMNTKYPDLKVTMVNIKNPGGYKMLLQCAQKFKLGQNVGTPLFCMKEHYLMGWSDESAKQFDEYVRPYLP